MYETVRLNVNTKKIQQTRKMKIQKIKRWIPITAGILALIALVYAGAKHEKKVIIDENKKSITNYYGEYSTQKLLYEYICLSDEINNLGLDKYEYSDDLYKSNISSEFKSIEEIDKLIEEYKKNKSFEKNIYNADEHSKVIFELINQAEFLNEKIYTVGYEISNKNVTAATKKYAGEVYGVDPSDITFLRTNPSNSGPSEYRIEVDVPGKYGNKEATQTIKDYGDTKVITRGIDHMINTQNDETDPKDKEDNNQHNEDRNKYITNAMLYAIEVDQARESENLYNSDLAEDLAEEIEEVSKHIR